MKAILKNYRQSPRKVRLVASLVSGKSVSVANTQLFFLPKRSALPIRKLIASAIANATNSGLSIDNLYIKSLTVDKGIVLKRMMPRAYGVGKRINKRTSNVIVILETKENKDLSKVKTKNKSDKEKKTDIPKEKIIKDTTKSKKVVKKVAKKTSK